MYRSHDKHRIQALALGADVHSDRQEGKCGHRHSVSAVHCRRGPWEFCPADCYCLSEIGNRVISWAWEQSFKDMRKGKVCPRHLGEWKREWVKRCRNDHGGSRSSFKLGTIKVRPPSLSSHSLNCTEQAEGTQKVGLNQDLDVAGKADWEKESLIERLRERKLIGTKKEVVMDHIVSWVVRT